MGAMLAHMAKKKIQQKYKYIVHNGLCTEESIC